MAIHLDHLMIPACNCVTSAKLLAELFGVPWEGVERIRAKISS